MLVSSVCRVNPHCINGTEDSIKAIDARWIDTNTGLYIDVTTARVNRTANQLGNEAFSMVSTSNCAICFEKFLPTELHVKVVPDKLLSLE